MPALEMSLSNGVGFRWDAKFSGTLDECVAFRAEWEASPLGHAARQMLVMPTNKRTTPLNEWAIEIVRTLEEQGSDMRHSTRDLQEACVGRRLTAEDSADRKRLDRARRDAYKVLEERHGGEFQVVGHRDRVPVYALLHDEETKGVTGKTVH